MTMLRDSLSIDSSACRHGDPGGRSSGCEARSRPRSRADGGRSGTAANALGIETMGDHDLTRPLLAVWNRVAGPSAPRLA